VRESWCTVQTTCDSDQAGSILSPAFTLQDIRSAVLSIVYDAMHYVLTEQNVSASISVLPAELLASIFGFLDDTDRVSVSSICRHWNTVLFSSPEIWSVVDVEEKPPGAIRQLVSFSKTSRLSKLDLLVDAQNWKEASECIAGSLDRCVELTVSIGSTFPGGPSLSTTDAEAAHAVAQCLTGPAPLLRKFRLFDWRGAWAQKMESPLLFGGTAPRLRAIKLQCNIQAMTAAADAFANVTHALFASSDALGPDHLTQLIKLLPSIQELAIEVDECEQDSQDENQVTLPPQLHEFTVIANQNPYDALYLLSHVKGVEALPRVTVLYNEAATAQADDIGSALGFIMPGQRPSKTMRLEVSASQGNYNLYLLPSPDASIDEIGTFVSADSTPIRVRSLLDVNTRVPFRHYTIFDDLVSLFLGELVFNLGKHPIPPVLQLRHLTVFTLKPSFQTEDGHNSVFVLAAESSSDYGHQLKRSLKCPQLQTLRIATRSGLPSNDRGITTRLDPAAIDEFMRTYLAYDTPQLDRLEFHGPELLQDRPADVANLFGRAKSVEFVHRTLRWVHENSRLLNWE